jgi:two-component system CheB/CheR fusion protein
MAESHTLNELVRHLAEERGIELRGYKPSTLERRVRRRMQQIGIGSYEDYQRCIDGDPHEGSRLLDTVLINVTRFFRDAQAWDVLAQKALPALFEERPLGSSFRVWCAGCASGEEPYSLAILLCEILDGRVNDYETKIYATDIDEGALNAARRAEYAPEALRGVKPEIREKYFTGKATLRLARSVRRMVIFGRSNLLTDAPISHVDLLLCRNVLIYFNAAAQAHIMGRLKHALNEGGVLFLGKSESQLHRDSELIAIDPRWRIFRRAGRRGRESPGERTMEADRKAEAEHKAQQDLATLKLYYDTVLATLGPGVLVLDSSDRIITENEKALALWGLSSLVGRKLQETELWTRCAELRACLQESRAGGPRTVQFECKATPSNSMVQITIKPILTESGMGHVGTLIYMENVTSRVALQATIQQLETTAEELQRANEELETTNEELQSTNEELETTNEELQSTNEELETTNEELQSLNEELENTNEELSARTKDLDEVNSRYADIMERMPWPVLLVNSDGIIFMFNSSAKKLFGFANPSDQGLALQELPLDNNTRKALLRRHRLVSQTGKPSSIRNCHFITNRMDGYSDIHFTPLAGEVTEHGMIVVFQVERQDTAFPNRTNTGPQKKRAPQEKRSAQANHEKSAQQARSKK